MKGDYRPDLSELPDDDSNDMQNMPLRPEDVKVPPQKSFLGTNRAILCNPMNGKCGGCLECLLEQANFYAAGIERENERLKSFIRQLEAKLQDQNR